MSKDRLDLDDRHRTTYAIALEIRVQRADGEPLLWPEPRSAVSVEAVVRMPPAAGRVEWLLALQDLLGKHALQQLIPQYPGDDTLGSATGSVIAPN